MSKLLIIPRATEKAYNESLRTNTYTFNVPLAANKQQLVAAVEEEFSVNVVSIKTLVQTGKSMRFNRGRNRTPGTTSRKDSKKAYVTLKEGEKISVFDDVAEAVEEAK